MLPLTRKESKNLGTLLDNYTLRIAVGLRVDVAMLYVNHTNLHASPW